MRRTYSRTRLVREQAQRWIVGFDPQWRESHSPLHQLLRLGVGGIIFFRSDLEDLIAHGRPQDADRHEAWWIQQELQALQQFALPFRDPLQSPLWLSLDQEGGQIERLPHTCFPSLLSPLALGKVQGSPLASLPPRILAEGLALLGFTLNFAPCVDINLDAENPIIGVRAYGSSLKAVQSASLAALEAYEAAGVQGVLKHFPGHGHGKVDSHLTLPTLQHNPQEQAAFQAAMEAFPQVWVMASHGYYPSLQGEKPHPATTSPAVLQTLLRDKMGFKGLCISDDLSMGAIQEHRSPLTIAKSVMLAGVDVLLFRHADEGHLQLLESLTDALLAEDALFLAHQASHQRLKQDWQSPKNTPSPRPMDVAFFEERLTALFEANESWLEAYLLALKLPPLEQKPTLLLLPSPATLPHYALDGDALHTFESLLRGRLGDLLTVLPYCDATLPCLEGLEGAAEQVLLVQCLPHQGRRLEALLSGWLAAARLQPQGWRISIGIDAGESASLTGWTSVPLHGWRPNHQAGLARCLMGMNPQDTK